MITPKRSYPPFKYPSFNQECSKWRREMEMIDRGTRFEAAPRKYFYGDMSQALNRLRSAHKSNSSSTPRCPTACREGVHQAVCLWFKAWRDGFLTLTALHHPKLMKLLLPRLASLRQICQSQEFQSFHRMRLGVGGKARLQMVVFGEVCDKRDSQAYIDARPDGDWQHSQEESPPRAGTGPV